MNRSEEVIAHKNMMEHPIIFLFAVTFFSSSLYLTIDENLNNKRELNKPIDPITKL